MARPSPLTTRALAMTDPSPISVSPGAPCLANLHKGATGWDGWPPPAVSSSTAIRLRHIPTEAPTAPTPSCGINSKSPAGKDLPTWLCSWHCPCLPPLAPSCSSVESPPLLSCNSSGVCGPPLTLRGFRHPSQLPVFGACLDQGLGSLREAPCSFWSCTLSQHTAQDPALGLLGLCLGLLRGMGTGRPHSPACPWAAHCTC